ncbi:MAG: 50S ribosomal protein L10, partial [Flavobacterium sp.]|nr:50S ribosomal protein L10 [Flavobacterium sp.]
SLLPIPTSILQNASGLSVAKTNQLRRKCFENGIEYVVVKNTLIEKALANLDTDYTSFNESVLKGFSGIMFHPENGKAAATLIKDFLKDNKEAIKLKGASVDGGLFIGHDQLDALSKLKSKAEMVGEVIGLLQSPAKNDTGCIAERWSKPGRYPQNSFREGSRLKLIFLTGETPIF